MTTEVNVLLNKKRYFYNRYSEEIVSDELINYIYHESIGSNFKNKVKINIKCNFEVTEKEKEKMMSMIRNNFKKQVQEELYSYEKEQDRKGILLALGVALLILYYTNFTSILKDVMLIVGWISVCSSIYGFIFSSTKSYVDINRLKNLSKARIYFE